MLNISKIRMGGDDIMWLFFNLNVYKPFLFVSNIPEHHIFGANLKDEEDDDDFDDDDDYYKENEEDKENPFEKEPTDKDIKDEDFPLSTPEDDLIDDDEEVPYN